VAKGKAQVSTADGKLEAQMTDEQGTEYRIRGAIKRSKVTASFTVLESDYFKNSGGLSGQGGVIMCGIAQSVL